MKNTWSKTLLSVYKYLERVCDGIDILVEQSALNSFHYRSENEAGRVAQRICDLCERKSKLVNIKVLVDKCLLKCQQQGAQLLIERYIDDDISENIAERNNLNIRTYFRKLQQAENSFSTFILKEGFSDERLEKYLANEKWILEVCEKFKNAD